MTKREFLKKMNRLKIRLSVGESYGGSFTCLLFCDHFGYRSYTDTPYFDFLGAEMGSDFEMKLSIAESFSARVIAIELFELYALDNKIYRRMDG